MFRVILQRVEGNFQTPHNKQLFINNDNILSFLLKDKILHCKQLGHCNTSPIFTSFFLQ